MITKNTILITGAASGLGLLLAKRFAKNENTLILADINDIGLQNVKQELLTLGKCQVVTYKLDLTKLSDIKSFCETIKTKYHVDILVNNAGIVSGKDLLNLTDSHIVNSFMVNSIAPMILTREFLSGMIQKDYGQIVNLCSASSLVGVPKLSDYAATKAAILNFDESLRLELKQMNSNVKTSAICPFYINTGMFDGVKTRFSFLLPILRPDYVADRICQAIERKTDRVIMPKFVYSIFLIKFLPPKIFDSLLSFFGINSSMEDFKGRGN